MSGATPEEIRIMRHALGADSRSPGFRNHYCAEANNKALPLMAEKGLMFRGRTINEGRDVYYHVTPEWREVLGLPELAE